MIRNFIQIIFFALFVKPFVALFIGLRVRGRENLPATHPFILFANHSSNLDALCVLGLFPLLDLRRIRPVAAADYFGRYKAVLLFTRACFNILPIARRGFRQHENPLNQIKRAVERGESILIFPQGFRADEGEIGPFKGGLAHLLEELPNQIPLTPVYLKNLGRSLPKGEFLPVPFFCDVVVGKPLHLHGGRKEVLAALEGAVLDLKRNFEFSAEEG